MKKLHELLQETEPQFSIPMVGRRRYFATNNPISIGVIFVKSRKEAQERFGHVEIPEWLQVHWCRQNKAKSRWEISLAYFPTQRNGENMSAELCEMLDELIPKTY
jgi:hypothetical protein